MKSALFWNRFEKSGSLQAYLRFRQAIQIESEPLVSSKSGISKPGSVKRNSTKAKTLAKVR